MPYNIQGNMISLNTEPFMHDGKHYVSLREVTEALGGNLGFDNSSKTATATIGPWAAQVQMDNGGVSVTGNGNTTPVSLTAPPYIEDGEMYVPFDFFRDAYGYDVSFAGDTVSIMNPNAA